VSAERRSYSLQLGREIHGFFLILTFLKLFIKLTPGKHYLHQVTPFAMSGGATDFVVPHAAARQGCHGGEERRAEQTWARACRVTCTAAAALPRHPAWRGRGESTAPPLSSSPSPEPAAALTQAAAPPIPAPNRWIWGGKSGGNRSPPPTSNTSQFQIIGKP
jgi:hypothetical protein